MTSREMAKSAAKRPPRSAKQAPSYKKKLFVGSDANRHLHSSIADLETSRPI